MRKQNLSRRAFLTATGAAYCTAALASNIAQGGPKDDKQFKLLDCHLHINHKGRSIVFSAKSHLEMWRTRYHEIRGRFY